MTSTKTVVHRRDDTSTIRSIEHPGGIESHRYRWLITDQPERKNIPVTVGIRDPQSGLCTDFETMPFEGFEAGPRVHLYLRTFGQYKIQSTEVHNHA